MHGGRVPESPAGHAFRLTDLMTGVTGAQRRGYACNDELGERELAAPIGGLNGCVAAVGSIAGRDQAGADDAEPVRQLARRLADLI
jgi:hypothetical protein